jgi:hypothetical protein
MASYVGMGILETNKKLFCLIHFGFFYASLGFKGRNIHNYMIMDRTRRQSPMLVELILGNGHVFSNNIPFV